MSDDHVESWVIHSDEYVDQLKARIAELEAQLDKHLRFLDYLNLWNDFTDPELPIWQEDQT